MPPINLKNSSHINQLTGLRFFAILLVFISHLKWDNAPLYFYTLSGQGYVGVSFFFVLSGFVLSYSYTEKINKGYLSKSKYILLRYARLMPLHLITALPFLVILLIEGQFDIWKALLNLTLFQSWIPSINFYFSLNAPSWSLSDEIFFYFSFIPLVTLNWKGRFRVLGFLLAFILCCACYVNQYYLEAKLSSGVSLAHWMFYIFPAFRLLEFITGMLIYDLYKMKKVPRFNLSWFAFIALFTAMYFAEKIAEPFRFSLYYLPFVAFLLASNLSTRKSFVVDFLSSRQMILLGEASFAFYLIHLPIIQLANSFVTPTIKNHFLYFFVLLFIISFFSIFIFLKIEKPVEKSLRQKILGFNSIN